MIYSYQIYETLLDLSRKDVRGRSLSIEEFNNVSRLVNEIVFQKYYKEFETTLENSESLSAFKVLNEAVPLVAGVGVLPARYYHVVGKPRYVHTDGTTKHLDMVSSMEDANREEDYLTKATLIHPTYLLGITSATADMTMHVKPTSIATIYLDYIRTPDVPILDYYMNDTTLNVTYLANGATVAMPVGSTAMNGTTGAANVVSTTVDFEWDDEDFDLIINLFLQKLGIQLPDNVLYEGGTLQEQKSDAK